MEIARANEQAILEVLEEKKVHFSKSEQNKIMLRALEREAKASRDILESYLSRFNEARTRERDEIIPATVQIIEKARVLTTPTFPKKGWISALAAGLTLFVFGGLVLISELLKFSAPQALVSGQNHRIAPEKFRTNSGLSSTDEPKAERSIRKEEPVPQQMRGSRMKTPGPSESNIENHDARVHSVEAIVAHLRRHETSEAATRILFVIGETSPQHAKFVNLARQINLHNGRTLFIDGTGCIGGFSRHLGLKAEPGLAELIEEEVAFEDVVQAETMTELHFISSGDVETSGDVENKEFDSRCQDNLRQALDAVSEVYDFVVMAVDGDGLDHVVTLTEGAFDGIVVLGAETTESIRQNVSGLRGKKIEILQMENKKNPIDRLNLGKSRPKNSS
ncbi:MAG: hypothetical protein ACR2O3_11375 [Rhizobiaceae bacterium]